MKNTTIALLFLALAAFALPSFAQESTMMLREVTIEDGGGGGGWYDMEYYQSGSYMDNPCTAYEDWVWVEYKVDLYQEGWETPSGNERVILDESTTVGGSYYAASGASESDVDYMKQPFTVQKYHKVNTYDDFHVVTVLDFDPATRATTISKSTACGNGMPDSKQ